MTAIADSFYAPLRLGTSSAQSSRAADNIEQLTRTYLADLKRHRADFLQCRNDIESIRQESMSEQPGTQLKPESYALAMAFVDALPSTAPTPEVTVDDEGELIFDWFADNGRMLSVCVRHDGRLAYAARFGANRSFHGSVVMGMAIPQEIMAAINSLHRSFV